MLLNEYWIPKIQDIEEFKKIAIAEQPEVDHVKQKIREFNREIIVKTASNDGLTRYEKMLDLAKMETNELRIANILQNINAVTQFTYKYIKNLLDSVIGQGNYSILLSGYSLEIGVVSTKENLLEMLRIDLRKKIPANISLTVKTLDYVDVNYYAGFYIRTADVVTI